MSPAERPGRSAPARGRPGPAAAEASRARPAVPEFSELDEPRGPSWFTRVNPIVLAWIGLALAALIALALLLSAGQQNYQSCVQAVTAKYGSASDPLTRLTRQNEVKKCSRSPF